MGPPQDKWITIKDTQSVIKLYYPKTVAKEILNRLLARGYTYLTVVGSKTFHIKKKRNGS